MPLQWTALSSSTRGNWHETTGQKNQDSVRVTAGPHGSVLLAVSDGHGGAHSFRSDRGSKLAVVCAVRLLRRLLRRLGPDAPLSRVRQQMQTAWPRQLVSEWRRVVRRDILANPFSPLDFAAFPEPMPATPPDGEWPYSAYLAYGATLLVAALTRDHVILAQLGDGDILTVTNAGEVARPLERHHAFYQEQSCSLCTHGAAQEFQVAVLPRRVHRPALVMLSTDGYANCFGNDEGFFKVGSDLLQYAQDRGRGFLNAHLGAWLHDSSRDGSGDDISVALGLRR
jgi:serine/threonine protein phosphatase PrpC